MDILIYKLIDPRNGHVRYVGKTIDMKKRMIWHKWSKNQHMLSWLKILSSEGLKPLVEIIETTNELNWKDRECYWIKFHKETYPEVKLINQTSGGDGKNGYVMPEEQKRKISASNKGRKLTPEQCAAQSLRQMGMRKGVKIKPEHIAKRVESRLRNQGGRRIRYTQLSLFRMGHLNHKHSEESKKKMSESLKGKVAFSGEKAWNSKLKLCEVQEIYRLAHSGINQSLIARMFKMLPSDVSKIKSGARWKHALNNL